jgi:hypothetical protein
MALIRQKEKCGLCNGETYIIFNDIKNSEVKICLCKKCYNQYIKYDGDLYKFISTKHKGLW